MVEVIVDIEVGGHSSEGGVEDDAKMEYLILSCLRVLITDRQTDK